MTCLIWSDHTFFPAISLCRLPSQWYTSLCFPLVKQCNSTWKTLYNFPGLDIQMDHKTAHTFSMCLISHIRNHVASVRGKVRWALMFRGSECKCGFGPLPHTHTHTPMKAPNLPGCYSQRAPTSGHHLSTFTSKPNLLRDSILGPSYLSRCAHPGAPNHTVPVLTHSQGRVTPVLFDPVKVWGAWWAPCSIRLSFMQQLHKL